MDKSEHKAQDEPPKDFSSKLKDCMHKSGLKRTVVCNECRSLLCSKCFITHLKEAHKIDVAPVEEAVAKPAAITVKNADEYKMKMNIIKKEQKGLKAKAAKIKNDNSVEELKLKAIKKINDIVKRANAEKNDWSNKYLTAVRRLNKLEHKYECKLAKANEEMDPWNYKEIIGKPENAEVEGIEEEGKEAEMVLKRVEEDAKEWDKAANLGDHKDEIAACVVGLKNEVIQDLCNSVRLAVAVSVDTDNRQLGTLVSNKKEIMKKYEDELKRLQQIVPAMAKESQDLTLKSNEAKAKLDDTAAKLKEYMKDKGDEKIAGFVRCPRCRKLMCNTCSGTANKCDVCAKTGLCKDCVAECSACNKKVCKVECMKKCETCGKMECLVCLKEKRCAVDNIYGNTIDLNTTDKKYFYCSCSPMGGYASICKFDLTTNRN